MCSCAPIYLYTSMVSAAIPLMAEVVANYRPYKTIITTTTTTHIHSHAHIHTDLFGDLDTHTCYPPYRNQCNTHTDTHTYSNTHFQQSFLIHFLKKSTLTLKLVYGLPTLLLLYVFPLEAITAQTTILSPTFSCGFITFGQRAGLFMSSMHCILQ